ncbi:unnamed protein product [Echinostoma caproni]|uniref:Uncharacterized protein n=1 Tax=Echinostoma caproni TaxID=27848 RepID=A0A183AR48_9TREM|nr:unnamed protein product [Echinostoma caproni]
MTAKIHSSCDVQLAALPDLSGAINVTEAEHDRGIAGHRNRSRAVYSTPYFSASLPNDNLRPLDINLEDGLNYRLYS